MKSQDLDTILKDYFGSNKFSYDVYQCGHIFHIDVSYTDFKPEHQVRNELEKLIPMSTININSRQYSRGVISAALLALYDDEVKVEESEDDGTVRIVPLYVMVEEMLFNKVI